MVKLRKNLNIKYVKEIPRTMEDDHYSDTFGWQWNKFIKTQIDDKTHSNSKERFFNETGFSKEFFDNKKILEIGSGAGRFTNIILKHTLATVYSVDSSAAVEANKSNNIEFYNKRLFIYQSSLYELPFEVNQFDIVICFGVIQHTPDITKTIKCLCENVKLGGHLIIDFYPYKGFWTLISAKYFLRPLTKRISNKNLLKIIDFYLDPFIKIAKLMIKLKISFLIRFLPIADIKNAIPIMRDKDREREMILLDTFDMLSPEYDRPQKIGKLKLLVEKNDISVSFSGIVRYKNFSSAVIRGIKN